MEENNKSISKQLMFAIAGVALLVVAVAGSAYAYFTASATSDQKISGSTLNVQLQKPTIEKVSKTGTQGEGLIPIYDGSVSGHASQLDAAASATNQCVDNNNYTVCQVYKITITNAGTNATTVNTTITLNNGGATGIKWARMTSATKVDTTLPTDNTISTGKSLPAKSGNTNGSLVQYIMVYLNNTGANQTSPDAGKSISGTITVTASTGSQIEAQF